MTVRTRSGRFMIDIRHQHEDGRVERFRLAVPAHLQTRRGAISYERQVLADLRVGLDPRRPPEEEASPLEHQSKPKPKPNPTRTRTRSREPKAPTLADYAPLYLAEQVARGLKPSSLKSKRGIFRSWILPKLGRRSIDAICTRDFTTLRMALVAAGRKPKTTNNCLTVLSAMVKWWHTEHDLPLPQYRVGPVKQPKDRRAAFYEHEPFEALVRAAHRRAPDDLALVLLGGRAGLRMSEIRALQWSDCDLGLRPQIVVQRTREDDEELPPKGWRSRVVPMTPDLQQALGALPRYSHDPHVLLHDGRPLTRNNVRLRFNRVQRSAGLRETGFHITRHTFRSHLAMQAVPATAIQALAGHADLSTTQRYMHLAPSALDDAIAALGHRGRRSLRDRPGHGRVLRVRAHRVRRLLADHDQRFEDCAARLRRWMGDGSLRAWPRRPTRRRLASRDRWSTLGAESAPVECRTVAPLAYGAGPREAERRRSRC